MRPAMLQRRVRALNQPRHTFLAVSSEPLVPGLAADPVLPAQRCHLILAGQNPSDKLRPFVHLTGLFPRHRQVPPANRSNLSPIHPVNSGTNLSGSYTPQPSPPKRGEGEGSHQPPARKGGGEGGTRAAGG